MSQANASVGNITVGFSELQSIIVNLFAKTSIRAVGVEGPPGGGKTALGMTIADMMTAQTGEEYKSFQINLSQHEPTDVSGIPYVTNGRMKKALTDWWPTEPNNIIVLEEITKGPKLMQNAIGEAIHEGTIGSFKLPKNTFFYLSWNHKADGAGDEKVLSHFVNRLVYFNYYPRPDDLLNHAMQQEWNAVLVAFLNQFKHMIFDEKTFTGNGTRYNAEKPVFATPRSWQKVSEILNLNLPLNLEIPTIAGCVGEGPCRELVAYKEIMKDMPDIDDCIKNPSKAKLPTEASVRYAMAISLSYAANKQNYENVLEYVRRFPKEFQVLWIKALNTRDSSLVNAQSKATMALAKDLVHIVTGS